MHIKEIILEGFKSYAIRTTIKDFDSQFNAITGLNGSGKSNILDAILFVLGISKDWALLRVNKPQEVIYKVGHAGITKAEVTIIFDNSNKNQSPVGYENSNDISVTRQITKEKSKFFVNGAKENQGKVKNMFRSVQMNIDNPHFLVAQGRITKIINLRPYEIVSMIEETAGTAMYNDKKNESQKIIQKKEEKVREINEVLKLEIEPKKQKMDFDRETFLKWKQNEIEASKNQKVIISHQYFLNKKANNKNEQDIYQNQELEKSLQQEIEETKQDLEKYSLELKQKRKVQTAEQEKELQSLDQLIKDNKKNVNYQESEVSNLKKIIDQSSKDAKAICQDIQVNEQKIQTCQQKSEFIQSQITVKTQLQDEKQKYLDEDAAQNSDNPAQLKEKILSQQLNNQNQLKNNQTEIQKISAKQNFFEKEIDKLKQQKEGQQQDTRFNEEQKLSLENSIQELKKKIEQCKFDENKFVDVSSDLQNVSSQLSSEQTRLDNFMRNNWQFNQQYSDPESGFDRSKVFGKVFMLMDLKDSKYRKAIESVTSNKLTQIVVETEQVSKLLLQKRSYGNMGVTFIPNNKITSYNLNQQQIQAAQKIAEDRKGFAIPALDVVNYNPQLQKTMNYCFGNFFIVSSIEIARQISIDNQKPLRAKCVTLDGDVTDPQGAMTGGFSGNTRSFLQAKEQYNEILKERNSLLDKQKQLKNEINSLKQQKEELRNLKQTLEDYQQSYKKISDKLGHNNENTEEQIKGYQNKITEFISQIKVLEEQEKVFEQQDKAFGNQLRQIQQKANLKQMYNQKKNEDKQDLQNIKNELSQLNKDKIQNDVFIDKAQQLITRLVKNLRSEEEQIKKSDERQNMLQEQIIKSKDQLKVHESQKNQLMIDIASLDTELKQITSNYEQANQKRDTLEKDFQKVNQQLVKKRKILTETSEIIKKLEAEYDWINQEKHLFGLSDTEYDYNKHNMNELENKQDILKNDQENLSKKVNFKVESLYEKVEKDHKILTDKRQILLTDKDQLNDNIKDLDQKKLETLEKCFNFVNQKFGEIFSDLLPGTNAKLKLIEGKSLQEGCEICVCFNNV